MSKIDQLIERLKNGDAEAIYEIIDIGKEAVDPLCKLLGPPGTEAGKLAAKALGIIGDKRAVGPLLRIVQEENPNTWSDEWHASVEALGRIKDPSAVEPLCRYLTVVDKRWFAPSKRWWAISVLGEIGDARAAKRICQVLEDLGINDIDHITSDILIGALTQMGIAALQPLLQELSSGKNHLGRQVAEQALDRMVLELKVVDQYTIELLCKAAKDKNSFVVKVAKDLLGKIEAKLGHQVDCASYNERPSSPSFIHRILSFLLERNHRKYIRTLTQSEVNLLRSYAKLQFQCPLCDFPNTVSSGRISGGARLDCEDCGAIITVNGKGNRITVEAWLRDKNELQQCEICSRRVQNLGRGIPPSLGLEATVLNVKAMKQGVEGPGDECERCGRIYCTNCAIEDMECICGSKNFRIVRLRYP